MSEYQYYEFQSVDRALSSRQMRALREVSSRADITPTRFTNSYEYGDFKGKPSRWMERYFDAFLYFANWGTRAVSLRVPRRFLDLRTARTYCRTASASARVKGPWLILDFEAGGEDDGPEDDLEDPASELGAIVSVRGDLMAGDLRLLYLGWLVSVQNDGADEARAPPCPPGLGDLTGALAAFARFMGISSALLDRAATRSARAPPEDVAFQRWAAALPPRKFAHWLGHLVFAREPHARAEILLAFRRGSATGHGGTGPAARRGSPRTARLRTSESRRERAR